MGARSKVAETILSMYHLPIGMEQFDASNDEQWAVIKRHIDMTDYYVLIIGHRFGSVIEDGEDKGLSYTQKEFRYAKKRGIPILVFCLSDSVGILPKFREEDWKAQALKEFKEEATTGRTAVWWENEDELARVVQSSLYKEMKYNPRPGFIRYYGEEERKGNRIGKKFYTIIDETCPYETVGLEGKNTSKDGSHILSTINGCLCYDLKVIKNHDLNPTFIRKNHTFEISKQQVMIPEDIDAFLTFISPIIFAETNVSLGLSTIEELMGINLKTKTMDTGSIFLYEMSFNSWFVPFGIIIANREKNKKCDVCIIYIYSNAKTDYFDEICGKIASAFGDKNTKFYPVWWYPENDLFGYGDEITAIRIVCHYVDAPE